MNGNTMTGKVLCAAAWALAALAASCSGDGVTDDGGHKKPEDKGGTKTVTLTATIGTDDGSRSRVGMSRDEGNATATFYWHKDDSILVQTKAGGNLSTAKLTTPNDTGTATAAFSGGIDEDAELGAYAVYPYCENHKFTSEKALTFNLPASYGNYEPGSSIFSSTDGDLTTYPANSTNMPMVGTISDGKIEFRHLGGLAVIRVDKMPAASGTLTVTSEERLSGDFSVADISVENVEMTTSTAEDDADKTVTFRFANAIKGAVGVFYLPLATGDYSDVTVTVAADGGETKSASCGTLSISRAGVTSLALYTTSKGQLIRYYGNGRYLVNGHVFVDLGLSVLWAETNVGVEDGDVAGGHYMWGETKTKYDDNYSHNYDYFYDNYKWTDDNGQTFTRYNSTDGLTTLKEEDDAASANWGSPCRMPTKAEFEELFTCTWKKTIIPYEYNDSTYDIPYYAISGKNGCTGNTIFIPIAGYKYGSDYCSVKENCYLWTSTLNGGSRAYCLNAYEKDNSCYHNVWDAYRWSGMNIRPVAAK